MARQSDCKGNFLVLTQTFLTSLVSQRALGTYGSYTGPDNYTYMQTEFQHGWNSSYRIWIGARDLFLRQG